MYRLLLFLYLRTATKPTVNLVVLGQNIWAPLMWSIISYDVP